ncbi:DNA mismatch repair protein MLH3-like isoform X2 [Solanum dulcamara]|uniref:DNA mismatch repair protein MLH3-like isoform X2 n=1 Tax=Solanum dulcamara TaxID=45834 RepID=UPI0024857E0D|nr:DNA mismatch repair protein MLH3-like isoform X2 [Solanum dulcamara]
MKTLNWTDFRKHPHCDIKIRPSDDMHAFPASFGFKGEALSYTSGISLLEIVIKTHWRPKEYRNVLKDGKCLYLGIDDCRQDDLVSHEMDWC